MKQTQIRRQPSRTERQRRQARREAAALAATQIDRTVLDDSDATVAHIDAVLRDAA